MGEDEVENIARPAPPFSVILDDRAEALATPVVAGTPPAPAWRRALSLALLAAIERATALNPMSAGLNGAALCKCVYLGRFDKAGATRERLRALDPFPP